MSRAKKVPKPVQIVQAVQTPDNLGVRSKRYTIEHRGADGTRRSLVVRLSASGRYKEPGR
jgi:hypothetical protein